MELDETSVNAWSQGNSKVIKGSHIINWDEGDDSTANPDTTDYSFEVVHFSNVGYQDSLAVSGSNTSRRVNIRLKIRLVKNYYGISRTR